MGRKKPVNGICKLCSNKRDLRLSHIIPEFMYKPMYDDKHRLHRLSTNSAVKNEFMQKGIREYLFCEECEQRFSVWEHYLSITVPDAKKSEFTDAVVIHGLEYDKVKLFFLSILFRSAVANCKEFSGVDLPEHDVQLLKSMLLHSNPGTVRCYPCLISMPPVSMLNQMGEGLIIAPEMLDVDGYHCARFVINTMFWIFFITNEADRIPDMSFFLSEDGNLPLMIDHRYSLEYFYQLARDLKRAGKLGR